MSDVKQLSSTLIVISRLITSHLSSTYVTIGDSVVAYYDPDLVPPCRLRMLNRWIDIPSETTPYICTYTYRIFPAGCRRFYEGAQTQAQ
ncbi:hypothetical protein ACN42_g5049 [Penicillium freii]|uniref:Uncharacterized protein n=1 Tax=Penicillium freii TaxID=48697 RepID=A0A101MKE9_PENFR|nr:hypothetical protein ACN42_g5049 [Penicillium freii]